MPKNKITYEGEEYDVIDIYIGVNGKCKARLEQGYSRGGYRSLEFEGENLRKNKVCIECVFNRKNLVLHTMTIINTEEMKDEILEAKLRLYHLLMKLNEDIITDNEVDIMIMLSKDEQIQSLFEARRKK